GSEAGPHISLRNVQDPTSSREPCRLSSVEEVEIQTVYSCRHSTGIIFDFLLALVLHYYGIQLPQGRAGAWPFLVVLFSVLPVPWLLLNRWGLRRFRREWNERGGLPASNLLNQ